MDSKTRLTDAKVKGLKASVTGQVEYPDADVPGLRVRVGASGKKTFILRKRVGRNQANITLGQYHEDRFTLAAARKKARETISDIEAGKDPRPEAKAKGHQAGTVRNMFEGYKKHLVAKGNRTTSQTIQIFENDILPAIGDRSADTVTRGEITRLVDKVAERAPGAGRLVHAQLRAFYTWALPRLDRLEGNPATYAGRPPPARARDRVLSDVELRAVWNAADKEPYPWRGAIKLIILTGARRSEVFKAARSEFDTEAKLWTIPEARAKNKRGDHLVPLSPLAVAVFEAIPAFAGKTQLFPATRNDGENVSGFTKLVERLRASVLTEVDQPVERWTLHDLRRTMATGLQRLGTPLEVTEACLNHVSGSRAGIVGVYQRHDYAVEKRRALELWALEIARIVAGCSGDNVVPISGGK